MAAQNQRGAASMVPRPASSSRRRASARASAPKHLRRDVTQAGGFAASPVKLVACLPLRGLRGEHGRPGPPAQNRSERLLVHALTVPRRAVGDARGVLGFAHRRSAERELANFDAPPGISADRFAHTQHE